MIIFQFFQSKVLNYTAEAFFWWDLSVQLICYATFFLAFDSKV